MLEPSQLAEAFARNGFILQGQTAGLTHEDSLLQPPFRGNCLNWVLGHIAEARNRLLNIVGAEALPIAAQLARYRRESEPVTAETSDILPLSQLIESIQLSQERIATRLDQITDTELGQPHEAGQHTMSVAEWIFSLYFHETYHTGQTELLRQLTGVNDKVI